MKKLLILTTTILFPLAVQAAEPLKVTLGGRLDTMAASIKGKDAFRTVNPFVPGSAEVNDFVIVNDTKIDFNVDGKGVYDIQYGGHIRLNADASESSSSETTLGNKTMVYIQHDKIGKLEAGNTPSSGALFEMDIMSFTKGSYGVDGAAISFIEDKTMRMSKLLTPYVLFSILPGIKDTRGYEFIEAPYLPSNYSGYNYSDAPKVNFFTKPVEYITVGITFIPDLDSAGTVKGIALKHGGPTWDSSRALNPATYKNIVNGGMVFDKEVVKNFGIKAMVAGEIGEAKDNAIRDLKAYEAGLALTFYKNIQLAATYGYWGKTFTLENPAPGAKQRGDYYSLGFGHQIEKFGYSVTYINSQRAGGVESLITSKLAGLPGITKASFTDYSSNKFNNTVIDVEYELAQGFTPYATLSFYNFKESTGTEDEGNVALLGTRLIF